MAGDKTQLYVFPELPSVRLSGVGLRDVLVYQLPAQVVGLLCRDRPFRGRDGGTGAADEESFPFA